MGVTLSASSIPKIRQAIQDGENFRLSRGGERLPAGPTSEPFWALITGIGFITPNNKNASPADLRMMYSFVRCSPCADAQADLWLGQRQAYRILPDTPGHIHEAVEINANPTPVNSLVRMSFTHWEDEEEEHDGKQVKVRRPRYAFAHSPLIVERHLPLHDHRDAYNGGFSFSVYHPGSSLPHMPWAI